MVCNHCGIAFHANSPPIGTSDTSKEEVHYEFEQYKCPACEDLNIYMDTLEFDFELACNVKVGTRLVYPFKSYNEELPSEVPKHFRKDFNEASQVLDISPKASAALARRLLEAILVENGAPKAKP